MTTPTDTPATILVVDDTDSVRRLFAQILRQAGYRVLEAPDGPSAIACTEFHGTAIRLVLCDVRMPGLSGPATVERLQAIRPGLLVLFISGDFDPAEAWDPERDPGVPQKLRKPISPEHLLVAVERQLASGDPEAP